MPKSLLSCQKIAPHSGRIGQGLVSLVEPLLCSKMAYQLLRSEPTDESNRKEAEEMNMERHIYSNGTASAKEAVGGEVPLAWCVCACVCVLECAVRTCTHVRPSAVGIRRHAVNATATPISNRQRGNQ